MMNVTMTDAAEFSDSVYVMLTNGDLLQMRGGDDWGRCDYPYQASSFRSVERAMEVIEECGIFAARRIITADDFVA